MQMSPGFLFDIIELKELRSWQLLLISKQSATISEGDSSLTHSFPKLPKLEGKFSDIQMWQ